MADEGEEAPGELLRLDGESVEALRRDQVVRARGAQGLRRTAVSRLETLFAATGRPMRAMIHDYATPQPARAEIDALPGATLLEFGTGWCGFCRAAQGPIAAALQGRPPLRHLKVEDGPGRPLGRSFRVKRWPTLVFLRDGQEVARLVRPGDAAAIAEALARIETTGPDGAPAA